MFRGFRHFKPLDSRLRENDSRWEGVLKVE